MGLKGITSNSVYELFQFLLLLLKSTDYSNRNVGKYFSLNDLNFTS